MTGEESRAAGGRRLHLHRPHPNIDYLEGLLRMDEAGHIIVNDWMETKVPGIFAAGDIRVNSARQVVSAAGDGATAAIRADHYISDHFTARIAVDWTVSLGLERALGALR